MNTDFDDYDDVATPQTEDEPRSRVLPRVVVGVAVAGFLGLAWYAYQSGSDSMRTGEIEFVEAEAGAYKEKPLDAGGEEFPHKDKTIYDAISPYAADDAPKVEKLLPEPEEPVKPAITATEEKPTKPATNTVESEAVKAVSAPATVAEKSESLAKEVEASIAKAAAPVVKPVDLEAPVAATPEKKPEPITPEPTKVAPVAAATPKPSAQPLVAPAASPAAGAATGPFKVQVGAYKSEAEAKQMAARIAAKFGAALGGKAHTISRADLPNGTFYRLRFGGFATADAAKAACAKLSAGGQGCFFAGK